MNTSVNVLLGFSSSYAGEEPTCSLYSFKKKLTLEKVPRIGEKLCIEELSKCCSEESEVDMVKHSVTTGISIYVSVFDKETLGDEIHPVSDGIGAEATEILLKNGWKKG